MGCEGLRVAAIQRVSQKDELNLEELLELCEAAGYEPVYTVTQIRPPHPKYNIGPGKLEELRKAVETMGLSKVIFGGEVKPVQEYNLAKALGVPVISRTQLILEIFNKRASSAEAKLQIRLAELRYELSRAREKVRLAKKGEQPGFHGLGAYEAEVYYDEVKRQMHTIYQKLSAIKKRNTLMRAKRVEEGIPVVALTGYTNAGKSTLFNLLTGESRPVSPQMFTTLSTTTRLTTFDGRKAYISDTVGFIRNLPPLLIDAFNSTLSEFIYADLILLVVDISEDARPIQEKIDTCLTTLRQVGVVNVPILIVFNKADLYPDAVEHKIAALDIEHPFVVISALTGMNTANLRRMVSSMMGGYVRIRAVLEKGGYSYELLSLLRERGNVIRLNYETKGIELEADATVEMAERIRRSATVFHVVG